MPRKPRYINANKLINKKQYQFNVQGGAFPKSDFFIPVSYVFHAKTEDVVSSGVVEQYKWERDTAISQLEELGIGFGQKKPDMVEVVRCKDCVHSRPVYRENGSVFEGTLHCFTGRGYQQNVFGREYSVISPNSFCAAGKRKMNAEVEE